ncbi:CPBP family intramembrane glutamic endopeptidase [Pedobacter ginsengisoli]|uniref:CPBP family intramembrane glutamic endopeptidase n=1 Tax=Pedobacter ginsengisoli TaxID=363852 RepID=UPI00254D7955|nr:type II CAAX endopeptidase family protein [Pedobacter ginsengisoli]
MKQISHNRITAGKINALLRVLLFCMLCALLLVVGSAVLKNWQNPLADLSLGAFAAAASFLLSIPFAKWEKLSLGQLGVVPGKATLSKVGIGFLIGLLIAGLHLSLVLIFGHINLISASPSFHSVALSLLLYLILATREEIAFRGYALRSLSYKIGPWKAQLIIAIIFALEHMAGGFTWRQAFFGSSVGAILFGMAALRTKGIALPIGLHAAWNFGQWCFGFKNMPGIWQVSAGEGFEEKNEQIIMICYLVVMSISIAAFYLCRDDKGANSRLPLSP